jgi:hypothetical protein
VAELVEACLRLSLLFSGAALTIAGLKIHFIVPLFNQNLKDLVSDNSKIFSK